MHHQAIGESVNGPAQVPRHEPRWPPALAILVVLFLRAVLPGHLRLLPVWVPYIEAIAILVPMAAVALTAEKARWLRVERLITFLYFAIVETATAGSLVRLVGEMVSQSKEISGIWLLSSAVAVGSKPCSRSRCSTGRSIAAALKLGRTT